LPWVWPRSSSRKASRTCPAGRCGRSGPRGPRAASRASSPRTTAHAAALLRRCVRRPWPRPASRDRVDPRAHAQLHWPAPRSRRDCVDERVDVPAGGCRIRSATPSPYSTGTTPRSFNQAWLGSSPARSRCAVTCASCARGTRRRPPRRTRRPVSAVRGRREHAGVRGRAGHVQRPGRVPGQPLWTRGQIHVVDRDELRGSPLVWVEARTSSPTRRRARVTGSPPRPGRSLPARRGTSPATARAARRPGYGPRRLDPGRADLDQHRPGPGTGHSTSSRQRSRRNRSSRKTASFTGRERMVQPVRT